MLTSLLMLLVFTVIIALSVHRNFRNAILDQWKQQLGTTTRILSDNLHAYIDKYAEDLLALSHDPVVKAQACEEVNQHIYAYCPLKVQYDLHKSKMDAIVLVNRKGIITKRFPPKINGKSVIGQLCPRGIESQLKEGKVFISEIFRNKALEAAISISVPVYKEEEFVGVLRWMVSMESIEQEYIEPIKIGKNGYMWVMHSDGRILAHHNNAIRNRKVWDVLNMGKVIGDDSEDQVEGHKVNLKAYKKHTFSFMHEVFESSEGRGYYTDMAHGEYSLAAYRKFSLGENSWYLIMSLPYAEITGPIRNHAFKTFGLSVLVSILLVFIVIRYYSIQRRKNILEMEHKYLSELANSRQALQEEKSKRLTAMVDGQELERNRISRELHDGIGQMLLAVKVKLEEIFHAPQDEWRKQMTSLRNEFLLSIQELKRISDNLMPVSLQDLGLSAALGKLSRESITGNSLQVDYVTYGVPENMPPRTNTYIYRIAQEAISNVIRHAEATELNIQLLGNKEQLTLIIQDNGKGFNIQHALKNRGNGLKNMQERTAILNGGFDLQSALGEGTKITLKIYLL